MVGLSEGNRRAETKGMVNNLGSHTLEAFKIIYGGKLNIIFFSHLTPFYIVGSKVDQTN